MKFKQLRLFKKNKFLKRFSGWLSRRSSRLGFAASVFAISLLAALLVVFFYDRFYGSSPWSNKMRLVKDALAVCQNAQGLANTQVDFTGWPLEKKYALEGQTLGAVAGYIDNAGAYGEEDGPSATEAFTASSWLREKYADYFTAQERCDTLAEEYQKKYSY